MEKKPLLIILSNFSGKAAEKAERAGLESGKDFILYKDLITEGENSGEATLTELEARRADINENDVVTISYTSGTTGNPKGIMLTHLNYFANSADAVKVFPLPERSRTLIILPLDHSFAHTVGIYIALRLGLSMHFVDAGEAAWPYSGIFRGI